MPHPQNLKHTSIHALINVPTFPHYSYDKIQEHFLLQYHTSHGTIDTIFTEHMQFVLYL